MLHIPHSVQKSGESEYQKREEEEAVVVVAFSPCHCLTSLSECQSENTDVKLLLAVANWGARRPKRAETNKRQQ